jgi:hypothetical protein
MVNSITLKKVSSSGDFSHHKLAMMNFKFMGFMDTSPLYLPIIFMSPSRDLIFKIGFGISCKSVSDVLDWDISDILSELGVSDMLIA